MIDEATIEKAVELLRGAAPGATVIVFGSCARGETTEDSDLDVLVVEPEVTDQWEEMVRLRRAMRPLRLAADVLVRSEEHTSELQSRSDLVCRLLLEKKKTRRGGNNCAHANKANDDPDNLRYGTGV